MNKKLLLLPGAADPNHVDSNKDYFKRYELVSNEGKKLGFDDIELFPWVGQKSGKNGILNLQTATISLKSKIIELEEREMIYDVIAFSWGANVYLNTLNSISEPKFLKRTVLWGIDEFWRLASYFASREKTEQTVARMRMMGTNIDPNFMSYELPNELALLEYKHDNFIRIGFGENDSDSPPAYAQYLTTLGIKENIKFRIVNEVSHVVTSYNKDYFSCLFDDIC